MTPPPPDAAIWKIHLAVSLEQVFVGIKPGLTIGIIDRDKGFALWAIMSPNMIRRSSSSIEGKSA
jgi:hypothetical protein